jgi:2-polyprenyl-6-methoxyphenol hydroxylase-like FAD-dependent oxidoreductase
MLRLFLESTPAADITRSALFERNGNLPTVDGRVALLGDAAQNYHPIRGEGSSKALTDGYVAAMRLATAIMGKSNGNNSKKSPSIEHALAGFDSRRRRKGSNTLAQKSCKYGQRATSDSGLTCWLQTTSFKFMTPSKTIRKVRKGDESNRRFVSDMIKELKPYPKPVKSIGPPSLQRSRSHDVSVDLTPSKSFREEDVGCLCIDF